MKALVLEETGGPLVLKDVPVPQPGPGEALVRVRACGVGLTLAWNRAGRGLGRGDYAPKLPRIIGHEIAGEVVEVGPDAHGFGPGDRVNVYFYLTCGNCRWCNVGREDLCDNHRGYVGQEIDGGLAEYVSLPVRNLCRIPDDLGYVEAAITADAVATPVHVLQARAHVRASETVLVLGAGGGVGIHMVQMAKLLGARVIGVDITAEKTSLATEMGADDVVTAPEGGFADEVRELTAGRGADVVVELVGLPETLDDSYRSLAKGGRLILLGGYDREAKLSIQPMNMVGGEFTVLGSRYCTRQELAEAVDLVTRGRVRPVVTRLCRLDEADEVLRSIERKELAGRACVETFRTDG